MKKSSTILLLCFFLFACQTIPYDEKGAETVSAYGDAADRFIVAVISAANRCKIAGTTDTECTKAHFSEFEESFYDEWESKLFSAHNQIAASDAFGICSRAAKLARDVSTTIKDAALKSEITKLDFRNNESCSMGSIGGVIQQHRKLRKYHEDFVLLKKDDGEVWRGTIAQSVRVALTVENFKKAAAEAPSM